MPAVSLAKSGVARVCVIHQNIPNIISSVSAKLSESGNNIEGMISKSRKDYAYSIFDTANEVSEAAVEAIRAVDGVIRVRVIQ